MNPAFAHWLDALESLTPQDINYPTALRLWRDGYAVTGALAVLRGEVVG